AVAVAARPLRTRRPLAVAPLRTRRPLAAVAAVAAVAAAAVAAAATSSHKGNLRSRRATPRSAGGAHCSAGRTLVLERVPRRGLVPSDALHFDLAVAHAHVVARLVDRSRAGQRATVAHTKARPMPGTLYDSVGECTFGQWAARVGAGRRDGVELLTYLQ